MIQQASERSPCLCCYPPSPPIRLKGRVSSREQCVQSPTHVGSKIWGALLFAICSQNRVAASRVGPLYSEFYADISHNRILSGFDL